MFNRRLRPAAIFGLLLFTVLFVIPVAWFLLGAFWSGKTTAAVSFVAVRNSVLIGLAVSLLSVAPGLALGWLSDRCEFPLRRLITPLIWMLFLFPSYLLTTGWQIVMDTSWLRNSMVAHYFNGVAGIVFLLTMKGLPFAYFTGLAVWRMLGDNLFDALAALAVPKLRALRMVTTLLLPAAAAAGVVVFIETVQEFGIPATLGASIHLPIVTYAIYTQLTSAPPDFRAAALLSLPLVGLAVLAATAQAWIHHRHGVALQTRGTHNSTHRTLGQATASTALSSVALLAVIGVVVPLAGITYAAIGGAAGTSGDIADWSSLLNSLGYAMLGAGLSLLGVFAIWPALRARGTWYGQAVDVLTLINMAIPGVVLGAAYLIAFNGGWLPLYGTPLLLVLAYGAAQVPMLLRLLQAPLAQIPRALHEAAVVHVARHDTRLLDIRLPLVVGPLCWGYALAFGAIFFELPISELLYPPGRPPFGVAIVTFNQAMDYTQAARLGLAAMIILFVLGAMAATLMRFSRVFKRKYSDVPVAV